MDLQRFDPPNVLVGTSDSSCSFNLRQEVKSNWLEILRLNDRLRCDVYCGNIIA